MGVGQVNDPSPETILAYLLEAGPVRLSEIEKQFNPEKRHTIGEMVLRLMDAHEALEETQINVFRINERGKQVLDELRAERERVGRERRVEAEKPRQRGLFA